MPKGQLHNKKRKKNFAILLLVFGWCVLIFVITIVKIARADDATFKDRRVTHQESIQKSHEEWQAKGDPAADQSANDARRKAHQATMEIDPEPKPPTAP